MLLKRYRNVHNPPEPMVFPDFEAVDDVIAPYVVESTGAQVTLSTAISLINRFLCLLLVDRANIYENIVHLVKINEAIV